jgi:hypothetical protein
VVTAQVVPAVLSAQRVDRVGAQERTPGRFHRRRIDLAAQLARAPAFRVPDVKDRGPGVLANRRGVPTRNFNIFQDGSAPLLIGLSA